MARAKNKHIEQNMARLSNVKSLLKFDSKTLFTLF